MSAKICIIAPGYIASTPRVFREADALSDAGFDVRVVCSQGNLEDIRRFDRETTAHRTWRWDAVRWSNTRPDERRLYYRSGIRHRLAQAAPKALQRRLPVAERGEGRVFPELASLAQKERADIYIGHYPVGLAAARRAARVHGAKLGYDIEDLYAEIRPDAPEWRAEKDRIVTIERAHAPYCDYLTAASAPMAEEFARRYATRIPLAVHNCHPWRERETLGRAPQDRQDVKKLSLYWYSQTIGLDRGLQDVIAAAGLLGGGVEIHLRGFASADVRETLQRAAAEHGVGGDLFFHEPVPPDELLTRAAEHDVGLALETTASLSRQLSVTNKLFLFLTAGLAVVASDLPGQRSVLDSCPGAAKMYVPGDVGWLARHLTDFVREPSMLASARRQALTAAHDRWNWEMEGARLVDAVRQLTR